VIQSAMKVRVRFTLAGLDGMAHSGAGKVERQAADVRLGGVLPNQMACTRQCDPKLRLAVRGKPATAGSLWSRRGAIPRELRRVALVWLGVDSRAGELTDSRSRLKRLGEALDVRKLLPAPSHFRTGQLRCKQSLRDLRRHVACGLNIKRREPRGPLVPNSHGAAVRIGQDLWKNR
jgi:hypothetical protein